MTDKMQAGKLRKICSAALVIQQLALSLVFTLKAEAIGVVAPVPNPGPARGVMVGTKSTIRARNGSGRASRTRSPVSRRTAVQPKKRALPAKPLTEIVELLKSREIAPGVVYKNYQGALNVNLLDFDMKATAFQLKPVMAGEAFNCLDEVKDSARKVNAVAAVNANYFKKDGTPLGTLMIDREWVAGPLYDRVSLGITRDGDAFVDRLRLHGILETSNSEVGNIWVNNINQPRRTGSRLIVYTQRWGKYVTMQYDGALVAVNNQGEVVDTQIRSIGIPLGGFVLCDSKSGQIAKLQRGDYVSLSWQTDPDKWKEVTHAISGGPMLIKNGKLHIDLKGENFHKTWTGTKIHARTAAGVTADHHLLMVTVEGTHTLFDVAKFLQKMGAVEAMNLDGGGSTTMFVDGQTVTHNKNASQRRVSIALAIVPTDKIGAPRMATLINDASVDLTDFSAQSPEQLSHLNANPADYLLEPIFSDDEMRQISYFNNPPLSAMSIDNDKSGFLGSKKAFRWMHKHLIDRTD